MPREALRPEMKDALAQLAKFDSGMAHVEVMVFVPGPYGNEPQKIVNGALPYFEVSAEDLKDFERWVLQHPSLGGARNYRCKITVPNAKGNYAPRPDRVVELNFAGPTDTALGAMAQVPALAQAAAQGIAEQADFYSGKAQTAAALSTTKAAEAAALAETDPKRSRELADQAEAAAREAKQHADAAGQQMANLGQVLANMNRPQAQQTPIGGYQQPAPYGYPPPWPGQPQPYYQQPNAYYPPQYQQQPPAAPSTDPALIALLTKLIEKNDVPARPAGPPPELAAMQAQMNQMQTALAEAKAQAAQAKADADRARDKAESDAKMAELRAELARLRDGGDSRKPDATLELAKIQLANAQSQSESQGKMYELLQRTTDASNARLIEILQSGGDDDYAVKAKALMSMQGEIFQSGMQMMQMASKLGGAPEGGGKEPAWIGIAKTMLGQFQNMGNAMMSNPQQALDQARATGSLQPPPVVQQQTMPPPPLVTPPPVVPPTIPAGVAVPPPAQVAAPVHPTREQYVNAARDFLQKDDIRRAFAIMKEGFGLYPDLRNAGEDDLAAAQRLFDGAWPSTATEARVGEAVVELYGAGILPRLLELSQAAARPAANDDGEPANSDTEPVGPNGVVQPGSPRPVYVVPPPRQA